MLAYAVECLVNAAYLFKVRVAPPPGGSLPVVRFGCNASVCFA